jgi:Tfp pilus assembly protein PilZ
MKWNDHSTFALTENISLGGLFAATASPGQVGDQVQLRFRLPTIGRWLEVDAEIRWTRPDPDEDSRHGARGMGLMFTQVPFLVSTLVRDFIDSVPLDRRF